MTGPHALVPEDIEGRPIVAFDFDGTLTTIDTFRHFLRWHAGPLKYAHGLTAMSLSLLRQNGVRQSRTRIKSAAITRFWAGMTEHELSAAADAYAETAAPRILRPDALSTWQEWQEKGALMLIVSASLEVQVAPFARRLGADLLIGTRLELDANGRITGALIGETCRGIEKSARLRQTLGKDVVLTAAYGDSSGDTEMLAMAEQPGYRVFRAKP